MAKNKTSTKEITEVAQDSLEFTVSTEGVYTYLAKIYYGGEEDILIIS